jgi:hypothetical protein
MAVIRKREEEKLSSGGWLSLVSIAVLAVGIFYAVSGHQVLAPVQVTKQLKDSFDHVASSWSDKAPLYREFTLDELKELVQNEDDRKYWTVYCRMTGDLEESATCRNLKMVMNSH